MKKILVDVDDVLVGGNFLKVVNEFLKTSYTEDDLKGYYIQDLLGDRKEEFFKDFEHVNLYEDINLYQNARDVLEKLNNKYDIYLCSAFVWREIPNKSGNSLKNKFDFLIKHLPFIDPNKHIYTSSKMIIQADIRIDDKISNLGNADINLLYTAYHNKNISDEELKEKNIIRVNNWKDIEKILN